MKPILKWAGGKSALLEEIKSKMPIEYNTYYEPFVGGGAVFFNVDANRAVINDKNVELINCYIQVREHLDELIPLLDKLQEEHTETRYYELRSTFNLRKAAAMSNREKLDVFDAALMIYLNKTGFNGMYRENAAGNFNIPSGKKKKVNLYNKENLNAAADKLRGAVILSGDFEDALKNVESGDFVYFDSPYDNVFNAYQKGGFVREDQERLAKLCNYLTDNRVYFLLSNSDSAFIRDLYKEYDISEIGVKRGIGFKGDRQTVTELLIKNY